jgi:hypothetical protein
MGEGAVVLRQDVSLDQAVKAALQTPYPGSGDGKETVEILKTQLIGEHFSLLYFPFYCFEAEGGGEEMTLIVDGLNGMVVKGQMDPDALKADDTAIPHKPLGFIPFKCPNCGWDLPFRPNSRVHLCRICAKAWQEAGGAFHETAFHVAGAGERTEAIEGWIYLPFWVLTAEIKTSGKTYQSLKDFYDLFPLPKVQDPGVLSQRPIRFFIPAFKVRNPVAVDKFAAQLTRTQPAFETLEPEKTDLGKIRIADLSLPLREALEMAQLLLFSMAPHRAKRTLAEIKDASVHPRGGHLLWLPFQEQGIFLREANTDFAIQANCLEL